MTDTESKAQPLDDDNQPKTAGWAFRLGRAVIWVRWLQFPLLIGLILALVIFEVSFFLHLLSMLSSGEALTREKATLVALDLIDMVLIANLIVMVVLSGYKIFITPLDISGDVAIPDWLKGLTLEGLKFRIAATVLLISTIHVLHELLDPSLPSLHEAVFLISAQIVLVITAVVFAFIERMDLHNKN